MISSPLTSPRILLTILSLLKLTFLFSAIPGCFNQLKRLNVVARRSSPQMSLDFLVYSFPPELLKYHSYLRIFNSGGQKDLYCAIFIASLTILPPQPVVITNFLSKKTLFFFVLWWCFI